MAGRIGTPGQTVSSRLLAVLECFDVAHPTLSLTQIAGRSGLPVSTARRLIGELQAWGGLERLDDGSYRIGIRLWTIGSLAPQQRGLRDAAIPYMHDLFSATQENIQLVVLEDSDALCIEKISSDKAVPTRTHVGGRLPLHATGVGKALLAHSERALLPKLLDAGLARLTPHTIVEPGRLAAALAEVRSSGLAYSYQEMTIGAVSVAAPILSHDGRVRAALGIVAHSSAALDRLAPAVRTAALGIARTAR
ncbi:IclR family transcriptional regulator [Pseudonocardia sp. WMMC193]|uniref:IclR family transcriptional regulator n=1 Tax=Pseudonocardia sp. WMMC193 TaxID=2911965 RepID=UPI001F316E4F|nr:IclR family transcriptional regulator [Pseudonocardia sp. WMMC193]MCF7550661.1 IclR family transcriptional regulator [Pseudonocardia sp. WMMC193]